MKLFPMTYQQSSMLRYFHSPTSTVTTNIRKGAYTETRGMNARIRSLREQSVTTQAHIDMERAKYFTEIYRQYEGTVSVPELRALALKNYFSKKTLYIGDGELIVGEKGCDPQAAPTFPDLCCHTVQDLKVMNDRKLINFTVKEEDYDFQKKEIAALYDQPGRHRHV